MSQPHVSRLLQGKTPWRKRYLQRIAQLYNTTLNALLLEVEEIPIVATIADDQGFPCIATEDGLQGTCKVAPSHIPIIMHFECRFKKGSVDYLQP